MRNGNTALFFRSVSLESLVVHRFYRSTSISQCSKQQWHLLPRQHVRGAKRTTTIKLKDLPQGKLDGPAVVPLPVESTAPTYPTVVHQARTNMRKFSNCVVLTRVGGFYELYFEQAEEYGPLLNLKVAQKRTTAGPVPMAGFPFFQLDRFLKTLVMDLGKYVAISEEFANNASEKVKSGGLLFDRRVTRIITPGTLVDEKFMDPFENNFLLAVYSATTSGNVGLSWLDLSTGEFFTQIMELATLGSSIVRIAPKEIVLSSGMDPVAKRTVLEMIGHEHHQVVTYQEPSTVVPLAIPWNSMFEDQAESISDCSVEELAAINMIWDYVQEKLLETGIKIQPPVRRRQAEIMGIDKNSMRGLEILETFRDPIPGGKGSLIHGVRRTVTRGGARLLRDRISSPSTSLAVIDERLDLVEHFVKDRNLREAVTSQLRRTFDSQRIVQKFSLGRGDADDLLSLLRTIRATESLLSIIEEALVSGDNNLPPAMTTGSVRALLGRASLEAPGRLAENIAAAIDEDGLASSQLQTEQESGEMVSMAQAVLSAEGSYADVEAMGQVVRAKGCNRHGKDTEDDSDDVWIMRSTASPALERLHATLQDLRRDKATLTTRLRKDMNAPSITLRWTPGLGHICHIRGTKDVKASMESHSHARNVSTSKSTRSCYITEWSELGSRIDAKKQQIRAEEQRVFNDLREQVILNLVKLRRNAAVLDELDIACSSATLASEQDLVRPKLNEGTSHKIVGGRHPTVKLGLEEQGRQFVSNDCFVGEQERVWLITGPNMAGKSTFLRQNALISIMAQVGLFVPAAYAEIGIVDQMFSRIGSADNLFQDQSTFMVEMLETAQILRQATPRSFVVMDEVGRGTTPEDGIAVGFATLHHLYRTNRCRTLFATHFHALADMSHEWPELGRYCTDVAEDEAGRFYYVHKLREGVNRQSHALKVARLAGLPEEAIAVAKQVLQDMGSGAEESKKDDKRDDEKMRLRSDAR